MKNIKRHTVEDGEFDPFKFQHTSETTGRLEPIVVNKPWGREEWLVFTNHYALKILTINPGHKFSLQYHQKKTESWVVDKGKVALSIGATPKGLKTIQLNAGDAFHIASGTVHRAQAVGGEPVVIIEVSTIELDDVVRIEDNYGRS